MDFNYCHYQSHLLCAHIYSCRHPQRVAPAHPRLVTKTQVYFLWMGCQKRDWQVPGRQRLMLSWANSGLSPKIMLQVNLWESLGGEKNSSTVRSFKIDSRCQIEFIYLEMFQRHRIHSSMKWTLCLIKLKF